MAPLLSFVQRKSQRGNRQRSRLNLHILHFNFFEKILALQNISKQISFYDDIFENQLILRNFKVNIETSFFCSIGIRVMSLSWRRYLKLKLMKNQLSNIKFDHFGK